MSQSVLVPVKMSHLEYTTETEAEAEVTAPLTGVIKSGGAGSLKTTQSHESNEHEVTSPCCSESDHGLCLLFVGLCC